ncbi:KR-domain-containing protein [Daldinia loculata]|uniref:KR-domain-containing protein n=1 Tax=Daldinia loculata TaxID=103429 RepID=UPI0020C361AF|nr:KR-domain-containing protein [Daldinia loculata]KAI1644354.1 KR-domain-containing protein [Daldinia loculata]
MVLRDGMFEGMTFESWQESTLPKIQESWNLHSLLPDGMEFLGQSNYAAGNTFKNALAQYRVSKGERAASINLGLFLSAGVLSGDKSLLEKFCARSFFNPMTEPQLFALLDYYCNPAESYVNSLDCQTIVHDAAADQPNTDVAYWLTKPSFRQILTKMSNGGAGTASSDVVNFEKVFAAASSLTEASAAVTKALIKKLADTLSLPEEELNASQPMHSYGVDSLVAVDLRSWFAKELQVDFAIFHILGSTSIAGVSSLAAARSKYCKAEWTE